MELSERKTLVGIIAVLLLLFAVAIFFYNRTLNELAIASCTAGPGCSHQKVVETQNLVIAVLIAIIGVIAAAIAYPIYWKKPAIRELAAEKPHAHSPTRKIDLSALESDEKKIMEILEDNKGSVFQSEIVKRLGYSKVKVSRVLDKLEQKGLVERKRRGMANLVVLK